MNVHSLTPIHMIPPPRTHVHMQKETEKEETSKLYLCFRGRKQMKFQDTYIKRNNVKCKSVIEYITITITYGNWASKIALHILSM